MNTKKQQQKKKARELKGKARAASRRHKLLQIKKEESRASKLNTQFREKLAPFVKDPEKKKKFEEIEQQKNLKKIERNMEVLKALEEEYVREKEQKKQLNEQLESEGHVTLQEKLNALENKARSGMTPEEAETGMIDASASESSNLEKI